MGEEEHVVIEPATEADLDELSQMLGDLFAQEGDFRPDKERQLRGLRLIFEQPSRGRVRCPAGRSGGSQAIPGEGLRCEAPPTRDRFCKTEKFPSNYVAH